MKDNDWYVEAIRHELEKLEEGKFVGSIDFEIHMKHGHIGSMRVNLNKSIKKDI